MQLTDKDIEKIMENTITIDENKRRDAIINYIDNNQGCTAEDIVKENKQSGRGKTFRILRDLKKENVIREKKSDTNKRDKKLFLNKINPLVSFPREVKEFKDHLYPLFEKAQYLRLSWGRKKEVYPSAELLGECFCLFFEFLSLNNYRAFVLWPDTIKDKETRSKLYMLFYLEMTKLNLEIQEKFQPTEFVHPKKKLIAKGMSRDEYLNISKGVANEALLADDLYLRKYQTTFCNYKLDDLSRPVVHLIMRIRDEIYDSQLTQSERDAIKKTAKEDAEYKQHEIKRQKGLEKLQKKLKTIDRKRKRDKNNPYPHSNYNYGYVGENYDPLTGKRTKIWAPDLTNLTPEYQGPKH
jgi:hypothetical protein